MISEHDENVNFFSDRCRDRSAGPSPVVAAGGQ